jgi:hypothetical protein
MGDRFGSGDDDSEGRRGERGRGWQRDHKNRRFREKEGTREYYSLEDRDEALEERYRLWCSTPEAACCSSLLQHVSTHRAALLSEYTQWAQNNHIPHIYDSDVLHQWEVERFGTRAYAAAHGVLMHEVRIAVFGDPYKRKRREHQPKVTPGLTDDQRLERMQIALHKVTEAREMPEGTDPAEWERRQNALKQQARDAGLAKEGIL